MERDEQIVIDAPIEEVWRIAAHQFDRIGEWSAGVTASTVAAPGERRPAAGGGDHGAPVAGRVCDSTRGRFSEIFVAFDDDAHTFTYEGAGDAMPGFVERARNTWTAEAIGPQQTRLTMRVDVQTKGPLGAIMGVPLRLGMGKLLRENLEELKHFIETGTPHERKVRAIEKARS